mmetsp:Transcript_92300/g.197764  ORF Transcript_92300/g.197764 Transcript_92300/m.197764 type:complete len:208 (-) Transcript_92300:656-1279(-)
MSKPCEGPPIFVAQKSPSSPGESSCTTTPPSYSVDVASAHLAICSGLKPSNWQAPTGLEYLHSEKSPRRTCVMISLTVVATLSGGTGQPLKVVCIEGCPSFNARSGMRSSASRAAKTVAKEASLLAASAPGLPGPKPTSRKKASTMALSTSLKAPSSPARPASTRCASAVREASLLCRDRGCLKDSCCALLYSVREVGWCQPKPKDA